jgi:hypothetical protein
MILDGGGGGMVSNHHLVLFTHALCQLSYPAADRSVARRMSGTPGVASLACVDAAQANHHKTATAESPYGFVQRSSLGVLGLAAS